MKPQAKITFKDILTFIGLGILSIAIILGLLYVAYLTGLTEDFLTY